MIVENFWVFALTALLLNLTPGNDMLYVAARSTAYGIQAGILSALGIMAGCTVHMLAALVGLSALLAQSAFAFTIIKYLGAAYLIYLGIRSVISKKQSLTIPSAVPKLSYRKLFWQGVMTNVLNPKVALFFLAFLPQFINIRETNIQWQILFLGTWFNIGGTIINILVAFLFGRLGIWLTRSPKMMRLQQKITGFVLIALGVKVALTSKR